MQTILLIYGCLYSNAHRLTRSANFIALSEIGIHVCHCMKYLSMPLWLLLRRQPRALEGGPSTSIISGLAAGALSGGGELLKVCYRL